jgi:hypothetical protein
MLIMMISCNQSVQRNTDESFTTFFHRFHTDTAFQMEHIIFPLSGIPEYTDSTGSAITSFKWQKEAWIFHQPFEESGFKRSLKEVGDGMIIETIIHEQAKLGMERRFAKMHDGWYLIFYAGLNPIK